MDIEELLKRIATLEERIAKLERELAPYRQAAEHLDKWGTGPSRNVG